ncbi:uncharacterized protein [Procambarus clarkii]|uniref:uncharacterized protein isoform X1 n=2 Tax=Procambarus clarkii TaxID=6728 RepID=UPI0037432D79
MDLQRSDNREESPGVYSEGESAAGHSAREVAMLKHASPQRSSSSLAQHMPPSPTAARPSEARGNALVAGNAFRDSYSERSVDCDSLIVPASFAQAEKQAGYQVGTWSGVSQANVRRGLSFSARRAPDALSFRSVRSEGHPASVAATMPTKMAPATTSMTNVSTLKTDGSSPKSDKTSEECGLQYLKGDMSSLKNLLRLPGVRGHAKIIEISKDGVVLSPDSLSLNSSDSFFTANSGRTSSRSWSSNASSNSNATNTSTESSSSTSEPASTTIRVFAKCLRSDIEYKTISVSARATCREVVALLLSKYRMRHRDPNLFYLTMEVTVRRWSGAPVRSLLVLEDGARPAQLALCRPPGDSRFALQMRRGGVIKVHDTVLMPGSQYKSLLVSERTTAEEVVQLLLNCYNRRDNKYYYAIHEVRRSPEYSDRIILAEERPLEVKGRWPRDRQAEFVFVLRRDMSQALSLRRVRFSTQLSLRTSEVKRPAVGGTVKDNIEPATKIELVQAARNKPHDQVQILIVEDAVIDCTDVTPKMTTINRTTTVNNKGTLEVFNGKTSASASHSRLPPTKPVSEFMVNHGVSGTRDSSTNTERKTWSNTSTQTIVSKHAPRSASLSRVQHHPHPANASQNLTSNIVRPSSVEPNLTVTKPAFSELQAEPNKTNLREVVGDKANHLSRHVLTDERKLVSQNSRCEKNTDTTHTSPFKTPGPSAGRACSTVSQPTKPDTQHVCKHNCQHCFYI